MDKISIATLGWLFVGAMLLAGMAAGAWDRWRPKNSRFHLGCFPLLAGLIVLLVLPGKFLGVEMVIDEDMAIGVGMVLAFAAGWTLFGAPEALPYVLLVAAYTCSVFVWDSYTTPPWAFDYRYCTPRKTTVQKVEDAETTGRYDEWVVDTTRLVRVYEKWRYDPSGDVYTRADVYRYHRERRWTAAVPFVVVLLFNILLFRRLARRWSRVVGATP